MSPKTKSKSKTAAPIDDLTFEQAFEELDDIVRQLEGGLLSLDEALALFERGQALQARCQALLDSAALKVQALVPKGDGWEPEAFEDSEA
jgi:exodeoxyribonuclease VII small subunit